MMGEKLIIVSAPSGAGKTTIVKHLLESNFKLQFSISATSRIKRENEKDAIDYYFLSVTEFKSRIKNNEFLEWEEVYKNQLYGTLKSEVDRIWKAQHHVVFDVDVEGGLNIKKRFKEKALSIFVMPPSLDVLEYRLRERKSESEKTLKERLIKAKKEIMNFASFDKVIVNDSLKQAKHEANKIVQEFL